MNIIDRIDSYSETNKIAHLYREDKLTYKELKKKSDALASYIIELLGSDNRPILVFGHKEPLMLICFMACIKSGHAYIPVDSSISKGRFLDIVTDSNTPLILAVQSVDYELFETVVNDSKEINSVIDRYMDIVPNYGLRLKANDVYYIIYTSGSTGKPKGVMVTRSNVESFVNWGVSLCDLKEKNVFLNQAPFSFDLSVMDLYISLYTGSTLFSVDKDMASNMKEMFSYLKASEITTWVSTPSFAEMCLSSEHFNRALLPKLKQMLFCGETLSLNCASKLMDKFDHIIITNLYGPTEATVAVTAVNVTKEMCIEGGNLPVGVVKDDCSILIMKGQEEVTEGEKGEIVILGESVAKGYYNDVKAAEGAFFERTVQGKQMRGYRTGDEGFITKNMLYYCGRMDFQIKLNGYRIEIEDIENNLRRIPQVKNAVVLPVVKEQKTIYLAALVVLSEDFTGSSISTEAGIKQELKKYLPMYMIPRTIYIKETIPMNSNGKADRKQLMEELLNGSLQ